ncbi:MAG: CCA tRNA nucleotidyltransferase [Candidatus Thorarchaeota archaeon]
MVASINDHIIPPEIWEICRHLNSQQKQVYLVGGSIRDLIIGNIVPDDWDVATDSKPSETIQIFKEKLGFRVIPTGLTHGTVTVLVNTRPVEVTTFRVEEGYNDGRRPSHVEFVSDVNQDLARRDLTCNAIAYDPFKKQILDPYGGIDDIRAQILRMVGDPHKRLEEDGLRALRIFRFVAQLGFKIEANTLKAIPHHFTTFVKVAIERIQAELDRLMSAPHWKQALIALEKSGLLYEICPDFGYKAMKEKLKPSSRDRISLTFDVLQTIPSDAPIRLRYAVLLHQLSSIPQNTSTIFPKCDNEYIAQLLRNLRFPKRAASEILHLLNIHTKSFSVELSRGKSIQGYQMRKFLYTIRPEYLKEYFWFKMAKDIGFRGSSNITEEAFSEIEQLAANNPPIELSDLILNGENVTEHLFLNKKKASERELIGRILTIIRERVELHPKDNTVENLNEILSNIRPILLRCQRKDPQMVRIVATDHIRKIYTKNNPTYRPWENRHTYLLSRWLCMCLLRENRRSIVIFDGTNLDLPPHSNHRKSLAKRFIRYRPFFINLIATREQAQKNSFLRRAGRDVILGSDADMDVFERFKERMEMNPSCLAIPDQCNGTTLNTHDPGFQDELESVVTSIQDAKHRIIILGGNVLTGKTYTALAIKKMLEDDK